MKLYHFTRLAALVGAGGMDVIKRRVGEEVDLFSVAAPGSILIAGLRPRKTDDYDGALRAPLPPCVWLTTDPDMSPDYCSSWGDWRLSCVIPSRDHRLSLWRTYVRKHKADDRIDHVLADPQLLISQRFYVYFGVIRRIVAAERAPGRDEPGPGLTA
jgi:hypothetical protein